MSCSAFICVLCIFGSLSTVQGVVPNRAEDLQLLQLKDSETLKKSDIKKHYYKLARKYHPDKNKDPNAHAEFVKIKDAFNRLTGAESYHTDTDTKHDTDRYTCSHQNQKENEFIYIIMYFDAHNDETQSQYQVGDRTLFEMAANTEKKRVTEHWHTYLTQMWGSQHTEHLFCVEMVPFVTANTFLMQWNMMEYHNGYIVGMTIYNDAMIGDKHVGILWMNDLRSYHDDYKLSRNDILNGIHNVFNDHRLTLRHVDQLPLHIYMHGCDTGVYNINQRAVFKEMSLHGFKTAYRKQEIVGEGEQGYTYFSHKKDEYQHIDVQTVNGDIDVYLGAYNFRGSKNWGRFYTHRKVFKMMTFSTQLNS